MIADPRCRAVLFRGSKSISGLGQPRVAALGSFDGIHQGHRTLLRTVRDRAGATGSALLVTFYPHPALVLKRAESRPPLLSLRQRLSILRELGFDALVMIRFTRELVRLSAAAFVADVLIRDLGIDTLVVGPDAAFGREREAGVAEIGALLKGHGRSLVVVPPVEDGGCKIGSRSIRHAVEQGDLEPAQRLMHDWRIEGRVIRGDGRGRTISIPTANIATRQLLPAKGVYSGLLWIDQISYPAVVNIGVRPTFNGEKISVEAHLYNGWGDADFYGKRVSLELHQQLRSEQRFPGIQELVAQIHRDIEQARELLAARNLAQVL